MQRLPDPAEINSAAAAKVAIYALEHAGLSWHLDDSVADSEGNCDIINFQTGEPVFTPDEVPVASAVQDAIWAYSGIDPHGVCIAAANTINPDSLGFDPEGDEEFALTVEEAGIVAATTDCPVLRAEAERFLLDTAPVPKHVMPAFGVPYAQAGVEGGKATSTCPVCGLVFSGRDHKASARAYATHFAATAEKGR